MTCVSSFIGEAASEAVDGSLLAAAAEAAVCSAIVYVGYDCIEAEPQVSREYNFFGSGNEKILRERKKKEE